MPNLLIHSMGEFADIIFGSFQLANARRVVEIGAEYGTMTRRLIEYVGQVDGRLVSIDPKPSPEAEELFDGNDRVELIKGHSLEVLPELEGDAYLIDGDHNYYTVLNESKLIWDRFERDNRPFLVFYHDVGWPCARRDQYCDPESIPPEYRHPHVWDRGITLGNPGVIEGGFRGEGGWACAETEGGPKNGVLTAIEDFVVGREDFLTWATIPAVFGLGILYDRRAVWAQALTAYLLPHHMNPLFATLERNRLECYLKVIEWQDRFHEIEV